VFGDITPPRLYDPRLEGRDGVIVNVIGNFGEN
jgi:hypothetical protein